MSRALASSLAVAAGVASRGGGVGSRAAGEISARLEAIKDNPHCSGWLVWRLVSPQDDGKLPYDHDQFDIHRDGGPVWMTLTTAASDLSASVSGPQKRSLAP